jgi:hypothetical protein
VSLTRIWTPTGSYSSGGKKRLIVIHTMEGFTGPNGALDCARYFQGDVGASSQVCIDNNRGKVWEGVSRANGSWTQCNYNSVSVSAEQSGYASWSRQYWLDNRDAQLRNMADWIAEESRALGIPIRELSSSEAQGGSAGVTYHSRLGSTGCGHSDPGGGWPFDYVLDLALGGGGSAPAPEQEEDVLTIAIPPGTGTGDDTELASNDIGVSLDRTNYTAIGFRCDAGRLGDAVVKVRVAWRWSDGGGWGITNVTLDKNHTAVVTKRPGDGKVDGVSFRRQDAVPITLYPNFA